MALLAVVIVQLVDPIRVILVLLGLWIAYRLSHGPARYFAIVIVVFVTAMILAAVMGFNAELNMTAGVISGAIIACITEFIVRLRHRKSAGG